MPRKIPAAYQQDEQARLIQDVWNKGRKLGGNSNPNIYRMDVFGAVMQKDAFRRRDHKYGWDIDRIDGDLSNAQLFNLRPLFWKNIPARQQEADQDGQKCFFSFNNEQKKNSFVIKAED